GAGPMALLLAAAGQQRLRHHQVSRGHYGADTLRAAYLVRGKDQIVSATICNVQRNSACRLHGIEHQNATGRPYESADRGDRLNDAGLVIRGMDCNECKTGSLVMSRKGPFERRQIENAIASD